MQAVATVSHNALDKWANQVPGITSSKEGFVILRLNWMRAWDGLIFAVPLSSFDASYESPWITVQDLCALPHWRGKLLPGIGVLTVFFPLRSYNLVLSGRSASDCSAADVLSTSLNRI